MMHGKVNWVSFTASYFFYRGANNLMVYSSTNHIGEVKDYSIIICSVQYIFMSISLLGSFLSVEFSSTSTSQNSTHDVDTEVELRELRLSLLMEIEKRKKAEEYLNSMRSQWECIRQGLYQAGIILPAELTSVAKDEQIISDGVEDLCQQVHIARIISNTIGKGIARAEVEKEMEAQLEAKNFDIARLMERLHCYETMNKEMSQRNQEAVGETRHLIGL